MGFPKSFKTLEIMQECKYGFTKEYIDKLVSEWPSVKDYAYITHDKDISKDGTPAEPHNHLMLRFKDSVPTTAILKKLEGVCEVQHLQKMKNWNSAIAYLTHSNPKAQMEGKHLYDDSEVVSNYEWQADRDKALQDTTKRLEDIITGIDNGVIREYNYFDYITMAEYTKYKRQIDTAFKYRLDRLEGANREMECIFITGESGCGKTTYAKEVCENKGYSYTVSSGSNDVLDNYKGQDAIILDDLRPSCMGLSDLLKMLDNNTASTVKSRYRNKVLECKLIVITTTLSIETFFNNVFESENESKVQLMRRCRTYIKMSAEKMQIYAYNLNTRKYDHVMTTENPIQFLKRTYTAEDALNFVQNMLGDTLKGVKVLNGNKKEYFTQEELQFSTADVVPMFECTMDATECQFKKDGKCGASGSKCSYRQAI